MKLGSIKKNTTQKGFTLVELITVVAIVSLLVVYITFKLGSSNEDAKVAMATTFLLGNVPTAISGYRARHMSSCIDWSAENADVKADLVRSGLIENTPWDEAWTASYDHNSREVRITFPFTGAEDPTQASQDVMANLWGSPQVDAVSSDGNTWVENISTNEMPTANGTVQVAYDCI